jgi:PDZ domain-containing secreted protein
MAPNLDNVLTALARTVAFSRMTYIPYVFARIKVQRSLVPAHQVKVESDHKFNKI